MQTVKLPCTKCNGKGTIRAYGSVKNGICFSCEGSGYHETKMNEESLKQYKNAKQINSLKVKLSNIEKEGKQLKLKLTEEQTDYTNRLNESIKTIGRELNEKELELLNKMYKFDKLNEQINQLRNEYKQTKELIKMLGN
jgi:chromosome segregation ATPase